MLNKTRPFAKIAGGASPGMEIVRLEYEMFGLAENSRATKVHWTSWGNR